MRNLHIYNIHTPFITTNTKIDKITKTTCDKNNYLNRPHRYNNLKKN